MQQHSWLADQLEGLKSTAKTNDSACQSVGMYAVLLSSEQVKRCQPKLYKLDVEVPKCCSDCSYCMYVYVIHVKHAIKGSNGYVGLQAANILS